VLGQGCSLDGHLMSFRGVQICVMSDRFLLYIITPLGANDLLYLTGVANLHIGLSAAIGVQNTENH